jgi:hypothetical protein
LIDRDNVFLLEDSAIEPNTIQILNAFASCPLTMSEGWSMLPKEPRSRNYTVRQSGKPASSASVGKGNLADFRLSQRRDEPRPKARQP